MNAQVKPQAPATKLYIGAPPMKPVRLSFPHLFVPQEQRKDDGSIEKKFSATFLLPLDYDMNPLKAAVVAAVQQKWGDPGMELLKNKQIKLPWRNQNEKAHLEGYGEGYFIVASGKDRPGVVNEAVHPIMDPAEIKAGMLVIATVNAYCWEHKMKGKGVSFGLMNVMKAGDDGVRFGNSAANPEDDFAQFKSAASSGPTAASVGGIFD